MLKTLAVAMAFATFSVAVCCAQSAVSPAEKIAAIAAWARTTAKSGPGHLNGDISELLGLSSGSAVPMRIAAYGGPDQGFGMAFIWLPSDPSTIVLLRRDFHKNKEGAIYMLIKDGKPSRMLLGKLGVGLTVVHDDQSRKEMMDVLDYFYNHLPQSRTNAPLELENNVPAPAPGPNGGSANAENPQDFSQCVETNSGHEGLGACTRSIESGHYQGHALALLYLSRAFKYDHTEHDYARAVADYEQSLALNPQEDAAVKNFFLPEAKQKAGHPQ